MNLKLEMTSREIAEETQKEHFNVLRDIEAMFKRLNIEQTSFLSFVPDGPNGRPLKVYRLDKDLTMTLVTKYDTARRYAVVRRWRELEEQSQGRELSVEEVLAPVPYFDTTKVCYLENQQVTATFCQTTKRVREIFLPKDLTLTLVAGWDVKIRLLKAPRRLALDSPPVRQPGVWSPGRVLPSRSRTSSLFFHGRRSRQSGCG
jgi:hypothetical protein